MDDTELLGRAPGQIEAATRHERTAVVDSNATDFPFCGFVTLTTEPIGNALDAAVRALGLNISPLVVLRPAKPGPYHEAFTR